MIPIKVLTVDDHPILREGIAAIIENHADIVLVGEAGNGREAIECFRKLHPDVTLMDLVMPEMNGIDATIAIRKEFPNARIVVLTTYKGEVRTEEAHSDSSSLLALSALRRSHDRDSEIYRCGIIPMCLLRLFLTLPSRAEPGCAQARRRTPVPTPLPPPLSQLYPHPLPCSYRTVHHLDSRLRCLPIGLLHPKLPFKSHSSPRPPGQAAFSV